MIVERVGQTLFVEELLGVRCHNKCRFTQSKSSAEFSVGASASRQKNYDKVGCD
jgi:hypothetical protein